MNLEDIESELELKTDTEKIVYLVGILKNAKGEDEKTVRDILNPIVQSKYKRMVGRRLIFGVESLLKMTQIKPVLEKSLILNAYEDLISNRPSYFAGKAQILYKVTEERPMVDEDTVRSAYEWAIDNERINDFEILTKITGIAPDEEKMRAIQDLRDKIEKKLAELRESE
ncbi:MAG: hypothetical protein SVY15_03540 [Halobacteriota archaeon]|nr:hypothetical protein [Halobacteriota archaeon]